MDIRDSNRLLYKYYPYSEYLLEMLFTKKAWYSKPETFNDPFDCYLNFDEHIPPDKYEKCIRWQLKQQGRSSLQIEDDIKGLIYPEGIVHENVKKIINEIRSSTLDVIKNSGVYCLSETNSNVTMWAHYADNHRGLCIGFMVSETDAEQVTYVSEAPRVNFSELFDEESPKNQYKWIFSKHHDWRCEKEWRVVIPPPGNRLWPIPGKIQSVTFGLLMDTGRREVIEQILQNDGVQYFEAHRNSNLLQLQITRI